MKKLILTLLSLLIFSSAYAANTDDEIFEYLLRQSHTAYTMYVKENGVVSDPQWEEAISASFLRLISGSGERGFNVNYAIINDPTFNAACFGGGEFVINKGALTALDKTIEKQLASKSGENIQELRENIIAPIIAHELGHYFNRHQFKAYKKGMEMLVSSPKESDIKNLQYSVTNEYEADYTGYVLLQKAGYNPDSMLVILEYMNALFQEGLKKATTIDANQYFSTHPSPHKRLAKMESSKQEYHQFASELEQAFDDVQIGINLDNAISFLDKADRKFPGNLYIKKERAVALHKLWLTTVSIEEQQLRGIIDSPAFRDEMVFKTEKRQGRGLEIPGNKEFYNKALTAYMNIYKQTADPAFFSNLALLLMFSPEREQKILAVELAKKAAVETNRIDLASNLAVVLYMIGERKVSLEIMTTVAIAYDTNYQSFLEKATTDQAYFTYIQGLKKNLSVAGQLNSNFVIDDFTPLLNLALMANYAGEKAAAKTAATRYLTYYEKDSKWAKHVSKLTGVVVKDEVKKYLSVEGIKVADTIQQVLNKWGKTETKFAVQPGEELWEYTAKKTKLSIINGTVEMITLDSYKSSKIENGIGVGTSRSTIEKIMGKHNSIKNGYYVYIGGQNLAVQYVKNTARVIYLLP